eukprot:UN06843
MGQRIVLVANLPIQGELPSFRCRYSSKCLKEYRR